MRVGVAVLSVLSFAVFLGCGGGGSSEPAPTSTVRPTTPPRTVTPALAGPSVHFVIEFSITSALPDGTEAGFDAFVEGDIVGSDSFRAKLEFMFPDTGETDGGEAVVIGDRAWKRFETTEWVATDPTDPLVDIVASVVPKEVVTVSSTDYLRMVAGLDASTVSIGGVDALRFDIVPTEEELQEPLPPQIIEGLLGGGEFVGDQPFTMSVWLTPNYERLLRMEQTTSFAPQTLGSIFPEDVPEGTTINYHVTVTLTRHNDPALAIEPPI